MHMTLMWTLAQRNSRIDAITNGVATIPIRIYAIATSTVM